MSKASVLANRPRRFYKSVSVAERPGGHAVLLDGRVPKTPGGRALIMPTEGLAGLLAGEWEAQGEHIDFDRMGATRLANTTLDYIPSARGMTAAEVARYAGSDVVCYFAEHPASLVALQTKNWGELIRWAATDLRLEFHPVTGLVHQPQPAPTLEAVEALANAEGDFALAGLAFAAPLYGSGLLALAVCRGRLTGEEAFDLSRLDEAFQEERWGTDEDARSRTAALRLEARMVGDWFSALR
jgi:chaperone required for assembly of F1-ATPase